MRYIPCTVAGVWRWVWDLWSVGSPQVPPDATVMLILDLREWTPGPPTPAAEAPPPPSPRPQADPPAQV